MNRYFIHTKMQTHRFLHISFSCELRRYVLMTPPVYVNDDIIELKSKMALFM